jgi:hypothetical protein
MMSKISASTVVAGALLLMGVAPALAQSAPPALAPASPGPTPDVPRTESTDDASATGPLDHGFEASLRGGLMFPGELSPSNWFHTQASMAPSVALDAGWVLSRYLWLGGYWQFTSFSFERKSGDEVIGEGDGTWTSVGLSAKGRLPVSDAVAVGGGLTLGRNIVSYEGESTSGGTFELSGGGWNVGATAETLLRLSTKLGVTAQLSFLSQVSGSADLEGYPTGITGEAEGRKFSFKPIFFFTIGPTLLL